MASRPAPVADWVTIPELHRDPYPIYERLRAEGGVHWVPAVGRYLVTSYAATHETELDQELYSANEERSLQIRAMGHSMLRRDDPEHAIERRAWQPALRPGTVKNVWTRIFEQNAERYLDEFIAKGPGADLVWDFAAPYAGENLRELIGLHNATQQDLQRWSQTMIDATGNYADDAEVWAAGKRSFDEVDIALDEMLAWHAAHLDDNPSLIAHLLRMPGERMPLDRIRANMKMTIGGGLNEPRDALGVAAWALLTHPEQRAAVEQNPSLWGATFDESIRWVSPIGMYSRQVTRDTVLTGVELPAGARLGVCILSANRDEAVWDGPEKFDINREVKPHLAFGKGVHVCLGMWVAKAEVAEVALPMLFERLEGMSLVEDEPAEIGGWVFRGMTKLPVAWASTRRRRPAVTGPSEREVRVAIVGSGPAGCFTGQALRRLLPKARIDVFDQHATPFGLVRYGVAPDHQGTKSVSRQFERFLDEPGTFFHGNIRIGDDGDLALDMLRNSFDAVVLATGLHEDVAFPVPGGDRPGVYGAGRITRLLNGHPDEQDIPDLGSTVAVVGHGNVAMDLARLLTRRDFEGSDVDDATLDRLAGRVRTVHLIGRSTPERAKFDPVMVRELAGLPDVRHVVHGVDLDAQPKGKDARLDAVRDLVETGAQFDGTAGTTIEWWFEAAPLEVTGEDPDADAKGVRLRTRAGEIRELSVDSVVTAIGFAGARDALASPGRHPDGRVESGLYVAGWLRRGPRGAIPDQRADAKQLARTIAADLLDQPEIAHAELQVPESAIDLLGWRRIDMREKLDADSGRTRKKLRGREAQLAAAADSSLTPPSRTSASSEGTRLELPVTVAFATESGGAELVAEELHRTLALNGDVELLDLSEAGIDDLDPERFHIFICSTYGDGELPTGARDLHRRLTDETPDLSHLRYAMFGMGDRSYTKTYSRGSELLDEALAACGAQRLCEYGRHDAGGSIEAGEAAEEWLQGVQAEALLDRTASLLQ